MSVHYPLVHATASAPLAPRLTVGQEAVKFIRTKPLGAVGALIIGGMLFVALFAGGSRRSTRTRPTTRHSSPGRARSTGSAPTSSAAM